MSFYSAFINELEKLAEEPKYKRILRDYKFPLIGAGVGALAGGLKGRSDAETYVTYHKLKEEDKKRMRRARMISGATSGAIVGGSAGLVGKAINDHYKLGL